MKKTFFAILAGVFVLLLFSGSAFATSWYACGVQNISQVSASGNWNSTPASCPTNNLTWPPANGDTLYANSYAITINGNIGDSSHYYNLSNAAGAGTSGGGFSMSMSTVNGTQYINGCSGGATAATACLAISGSANAVTILGNSSPTIIGGSTTTAYGVSDTHTSATLIVGSAAIPFTISGGSGTTGKGWFVPSGSGPTTIYGRSIATTATGIENQGIGTIIVNGDCQGSDTVTTSVGCASTGSTGNITLTGNEINGLKGAGISGLVYYAPNITYADMFCTGSAAPLAGCTGLATGNYANFIMSPKTSSYTSATVSSWLTNISNGYATMTPADPGVSNVKSGVYEGLLVGTYSGGAGGGSYGL